MGTVYPIRMPNSCLAALCLGFSPSIPLEFASDGGIEIIVDDDEGGCEGEDRSGVDSVAGGARDWEELNVLVVGGAMTRGP